MGEVTFELGFESCISGKEVAIDTVLVLFSQPYRGITDKYRWYVLTVYNVMI